MLEAIHHIQLAMPRDGEDRARVFYGDLLGLSEVPKPPNLAKRGGVWFERGSIRLHLGVEEPFTPARKAHPAFLVNDLAALSARLESANIAVSEGEPLDGFDRLYVNDPFGNRIELMQVQSGTAGLMTF